MTKYPETKTLTLEEDDAWLTIWFNQIDTRNALSNELVSDVIAVLNAIENDRSVRGVTFRGKGGIFCAGGDLKAFKRMTDGNVSRSDVIALSKHAGHFFHKIASLPQVTIALVEGAAMAGGLGVVCGCDFVIVEESAKFALTEARIGLSPAQISPLIVRKLGEQQARRLMLTGARFDGTIAGQIGLADHVVTTVDEAQLKETSIRQEVIACAPEAIAQTKALLENGRHKTPEDMIDYAAENFADCFLSEDGKEGVKSFLEKRKPRWTSKEGEQS